MAGTPGYNISLAAKCQFLFGLAVLLIVAATLFVPLMWSASLSTDADKVRAEKVAMAAHSQVDFQGQEWTKAQADLTQRWPDIVRRYGLESLGPPKLISSADEEEVKRAAPSGFVVESFDKFKRRPDQLYQWKVQEDDAGKKVVRLAMAVRAAPTSTEPVSLLGIIDVRVPIHPENQQLNIIVSVLAGLSGCALSILVFYLITQKVFLSPVRGLRRVAEQVSAGDLTVRSQVVTGDEFQDLGEAFNQMLTHLQATQIELKTINRSLDVRLEELAQTNVTLFEANRVKNEFLSTVSHELRTPLSSIIGFAELVGDALENPPSDPRRPVRYANNILISARMLLDLINDLLDIAKIEAGKLELHLSEFDPAGVCSDLLDLVRPLAEKKGIRIETDIPAETLVMRSDSGRIKQILYNLLSNAIKFTPEGGQIKLRAGFSDNHELVVHVEDSGPGIPDGQRESIFEKFRQLDSSVTREYGGTGLGLAITRELVHILGGRIHVESQLGQGSVFTVTLPLLSPTEAKMPLVRLT